MQAKAEAANEEIQPATEGVDVTAVTEDILIDANVVQQTGVNTALTTENVADANAADVIANSVQIIDSINENTSDVNFVQSEPNVTNATYVVQGNDPPTFSIANTENADFPEINDEILDPNFTQTITLDDYVNSVIISDPIPLLVDTAIAASTSS